VGEESLAGSRCVSAHVRVSEGRALRSNHSTPAIFGIRPNIAEGCGRGTDPDFARFLQIAMGSASEAEYQMLLSRDLGYLAEEQYVVLQGAVSEVKRM